MLTVHHLGISQSERIVWLCEELEIPYELKRYARAPALAPAEYKALHPMGIAPVITDGDLTLGESGAIIEYIIAKFGNGRLALKPEDKDFANYLYWFHFANATLMANEMLGLIVQPFGGALEGTVGESLLERIKLGYEAMNHWLATHDYFAGSKFSAADIIIFFPLTTMRAFSKRDLAAYPNILAYLKRVGVRPAYQRAMAKGDPNLTPMLT